MNRRSRVTTMLLVAVFLASCESLTRSTRIADIRATPGAYLGREIVLRGVVEDSWKIPFVESRFYTVRDETGALTILTSVDPPLAGAAITVRGRVEDVAVIAGRSIGIHVRETEHNVRRHRAAN